ncbi:MAG: hypothetical protein O2968_16285 [Acidobacteria bacterium]|nr:hypothetical protein [Acidobacteriota bacterium]
MHVQDGRASYFGKQPFPFHWLSADDLGRMVAAAYTTDEAVGKKLTLWGPEGLFIADTLERYVSAMHPEIKKVSSLPFWLAGLIAAALRNQPMKTAIEVYKMYEGVGGDDGDPSEANRILGTPKHTLADWLQRSRQ